MAKKKKIGWPDALILESLCIVVSREQCHAWFKRIEEGEQPLHVGLLPPMPGEYLQHLGVQISLSRIPPLEARKRWMFLCPRWVN